MDEKVDLSGNLDAKIEIQTASSGVMFPMTPSAAKEWVSTRRKNVRSWSEFLNSSRFQKPTSIAMGGKRVIKNIEHFLSNYLFVFIGLIIFCIMTSPMLLIALGVVGGACYMVSVKHQNQPLKVMGRELTLSQQYAAIGVLSFPVLWISGAGAAVFWILGASFFLITLHAAFYQQLDESTGFDLEMEEVNIS